MISAGIARGRQALEAHAPEHGADQAVREVLSN